MFFKLVTKRPFINYCVYRANLKLQSATKLVGTRSDVLLTLKGENIAFPPPSPPCIVVPLFKLPIENNKHPNFEWRGRGRSVVLLFSEVTYLSTMSQQFCRRL